MVGQQTSMVVAWHHPSDPNNLTEYGTANVITSEPIKASTHAAPNVMQVKVGLKATPV